MSLGDRFAVKVGKGRKERERKGWKGRDAKEEMDDSLNKSPDYGPGNSCMVAPKPVLLTS